MKNTLRLLLHTSVLALLTLSESAIGESYTLSGQAITKRHVSGQWDGKHTFPDVYCTSFPMPEKALYTRSAYFNNQSIYLVDVLYPEKIVAFIAVSTIPAGQSAADAVKKIIVNERVAEATMASAGVGYKVSELSTDFGQTVAIVSTNPSLGNRNGPFPLSKSFFASPNPEKPVGSVSVHRLFARGQNRFEVAVIQQAPQLSSIEVGAEMETKLSSIADEIVGSLQKCTASIPTRSVDLQ
jgi:hypothetical protein